MKKTITADYATGPLEQWSKPITVDHTTGPLEQWSKPFASGPLEQ